MPGYHINSEACRRQGFHFRQVYAALRFSRDKNKAGILDVYWDCGFLGVKDGIIPPTASILPNQSCEMNLNYVILNTFAPAI